MNYKKGLFRVTIVISIINIIIGLIIGINQFSYVYKKYNSNLQSYESYHKDMLNLLNNNINKLSKNDNNNTLKDKVMQDFVFVRDNIIKAEKFKIKKEIIGRVDLDSTFSDEYISVKEIIYNGINKKMDDKIKNKIADEFASANVDTSFPWGALIDILLIPLIFGIIIWVVYYTIKFIVIGFQN